MSQDPSQQALPSAQLVADRVFTALDRFLRIEALSGVALLLAATAALVWGNSPAADSYHALWQSMLTIGIGAVQSSQTLHFWINDGLMTIFFLVVGMEVRREIHEGALANARLAALPLVAAIGGVVMPALCYFAVTTDPALRAGWAVPTATDIAFAVGVLALLGRSVPAPVRVLLLALAVIDDIAAVIIIAVFYSDGLQYSGFLIAAVGVLIVLGLQRIGIGAAYAYVPPGAVVWFGLLHSGVHPTLAGVVLGLLTPVVSLRARERPVDVAFRALNVLAPRWQSAHHDTRALLEPVRQLRYAQREILPPVVRVQAALHPWVAFGVMPLFALANAGVNIGGVDFQSSTASDVMFGVLLALLIGKPVGIVLTAWIAVRLRWCALPRGVTWPGVLVVGCLGGIGFTMSIFIATLAFGNNALLAAAKSGVLLASAGAGILGLTLGRLWLVRNRVRST